MIFGHQLRKTAHNSKELETSDSALFRISEHPQLFPIHIKPIKWNNVLQD
jgi:hypothetical protein